MTLQSTETWRNEQRVYELYRLYDANNELLYIGITCRGSKRLKEHLEDKPWAWMIAREERTVMFRGEQVTFWEAHAEEQKRIAVEKPLANDEGNGSRGAAFRRSLANDQALQATWITYLLMAVSLVMLGIWVFAFLAL